MIHAETPSFAAPSAHRPQRAVAVCLAALALFLAAAISARAADDDWDDDPPANAQQAVVQQQFVLAPENFDQWVFGGVIMRDPRQGIANQLNQRCQAVVDMRIATIDRSCSLSDSQKTKLRLAASGDIKRFCDEYEAMRQKYMNTQQDPNNVNQIFVAIQPLRLQWQNGIFGDDSLFQKVVTTTLQPEQVSQFQSDEVVRNKARYQAKIKLAVVSLDNNLAFTETQRQELEKLLWKRPRRKNSARTIFTTSCGRPRNYPRTN